MTNTIEIYTDGACKGNPGPGGWGVLLRSGSHEKELFGGAPDTTNNRMELTAVIRALQALKRRSRVSIHTDSQYVQKGVTEWLAGWKARGWRTAARQPVRNLDLWQELEPLLTQHDLSWHWVRGHSGHPENERADQLANFGVESIAPGAGSSSSQEAV
jgi:ribonuclease HI